MTLLDEKFLVVYFMIKIFDDGHRIGGKDHFITLTVNEQTWHLALMNNLCDVYLEWVEFMGFEVFLQHINAEINEQLW